MQFAYIPGAGRGTVEALTMINHNILKSIDDKSGAVRVLTGDFSKASDSLTSDSILSAVVKFKFAKRAFALLEDFLICRRQRVKTANDVSDRASIKSGSHRAVCWVP